MVVVVAAKSEDFLEATDGRLIVLPTVLSKKTFHQPCLRQIRRYVQNPVEKDLGNLPPFLGESASRMPSIHSENRVITMSLRSGVFLGDFMSEKHLQYAH
jgi:hypothetical protein